MSSAANGTDLRSLLRSTASLTPATRQLLSKHGFDSNDSLLAIDCDKDLPLLTDIIVGQRAIIRRVITEYKSADPSTAPDPIKACDESCAQSKEQIQKIMAVIGAEDNQAMRQSMATMRAELIHSEKLVAEKDTKIKKLEADNRRLEADNRKLAAREKELLTEWTNTLKEVSDRDAKVADRDVKIDHLKTKLIAMKRHNVMASDAYNTSSKLCLESLQCVKQYLTDESMAIHRQNTAFDASPVELLVVSDVAVISAPIAAKIKQKVAKDLNNLRQTALRKNAAKGAPPPLNGIHSPNRTANNNQVIVPKIEPTDSDSNSSQSSRLSANLVTTKKSPPISAKCDDNSVVTSTRDDSRVSSATPASEVTEKRPIRKSSDRIRAKRLRRSGESVATTPAVKRESPINGSSIVLLTLDESSQSDYPPEEMPPSTVTLSTITASPLAKREMVIDIDQSDNESAVTTDAIESAVNSPLVLRQSVDTADTMSQISTSNGYLSDSSQESRCSVVNTTAGAVVGGATTATVSSTGGQPKKKGYRCSRPDCDFTTLFDNKFNDHLKNHVNYHFGQELPDFWRNMLNAPVVYDYTAGAAAQQPSPSAPRSG